MRFKVIDVLANVKLPPRSFCFVILLLLLSCSPLVFIVAHLY